MVVVVEVEVVVAVVVAVEVVAAEAAAVGVIVRTAALGVVTGVRGGRGEIPPGGGRKEEGEGM